MKREQLFWMLGYSSIALFCGAVFLYRWWFMLAAVLFGIRLGRAQWKSRIQEREERENREQFQAFLEVVHARLDSGSNVQQALEQALYQLERQFGKKASLGDFQVALKKIVGGTYAGISLRESFSLLIREEKDPLRKAFFANLSTGMTQGADLAMLSGSFLRLLTEEQELRLDREAKLASPKREQRLLFAMPVVMLCVMYTTGLASTEYRLIDYGVRLVCGLLFYSAWRWSLRILHDSGLQVRESVTK